MKKNKYFLGGDTGSLLLNTATSAGMGALTGGPVGALLGGGSALLSGLLSPKREEENKQINNPIVPKLKLAALGGDTNTNNNGFSEITTGGTHEVNPFGGVPISFSSSGVNMAEEGETKHGSYIFSNRLKLESPETFGLHSKYKNRSYADVSKKYVNEERPHDVIASKTSEQMLDRLKKANDSSRTESLDSIVNIFKDGGQLDEVTVFGDAKTQYEDDMKAYQAYQDSLNVYNSGNREYENAIQGELKHQDESLKRLLSEPWNQDPEQQAILKRLKLERKDYPSYTPDRRINPNEIPDLKYTNAHSNEWGVETFDWRHDVPVGTVSYVPGAILGDTFTNGLKKGIKPVDFKGFTRMTGYPVYKKPTNPVSKPKMPAPPRAQMIDNSPMDYSSIFIPSDLKHTIYDAPTHKKYTDKELKKMGYGKKNNTRTKVPKLRLDPKARWLNNGTLFTD